MWLVTVGNIFKIYIYKLVRARGFNVRVPIYYACSTLITNSNKKIWRKVDNRVSRGPLVWSVTVRLAGTVPYVTHAGELLFSFFRGERDSRLLRHSTRHFWLTFKALRVEWRNSTPCVASRKRNIYWKIFPFLQQESKLQPVIYYTEKS